MDGVCGLKAFGGGEWVARALRILCGEGAMREKEGKDASELAWELFEKTGNVTYYMLYQQLKR